MEQTAEELTVDRDVLLVYLTTQFGEQVLELRNELRSVRREKGELEGELDTTVRLFGEEMGKLESEWQGVKAELDTTLRLFGEQKGILKTLCQNVKTLLGNAVRLAREENGKLKTECQRVKTKFDTAVDLFGVEKGKLETQCQSGRIKLCAAVRSFEIMRNLHGAAVREKLHLQTVYDEAIQAKNDLDKEIQQYRLANNQTGLKVTSQIGSILAYFVFAITVCYFNSPNFTGMESGKYNLLNSVYYAVITTLSVGYGDIKPSSTGTKLFTCVMAVLGALVTNCMTNVQVYVWKKVKGWLLSDTSEQMMKAIIVILSSIAILISIFGGMWSIYHFENGETIEKKKGVISGIDSFYLTIMTLTTVGFGDFSLKTLYGREFAIVWLLMCQPLYASTVTYVMNSLAGVIGCS